MNNIFSKYQITITIVVFLFFSPVLSLHASDIHLEQNESIKNVQQLPQKSKNKYRKFDTKRLQGELSKFITEYAQLTPKEARDFFPVYFSMHDKIRNIERKKARILRLNTSIQQTTIDSKRAINELCQLEKKSSKIEVEYIQRCSKIIGSQKYLKVLVAERKFNRRVFKDMTKGRKR